MPSVSFSQDFTGSWDVVADGRTISRFEIVLSGDEWSATWLRPTQYYFDGNTFEKVKGPIIRRSASAVRACAEEVELIFPDPTPDSVPDKFRLRKLDSDHLLMDYVGMGYEPITLTRSSGGNIGPWSVTARYTRTVFRTRNQDISRLAAEDQRDRENSALSTDTLGKNDASRKARALSLLKNGKLSSGADFFDAALLFQHGSTTNDYLLSHVLATIATARGNSDARWLAAASLDRYLQSIGQPQVFGTQYTTSNISRGYTYATGLIPDIVRGYMKVPLFAEQDDRIKKQAVSSKSADSP